MPTSCLSKYGDCLQHKWILCRLLSLEGILKFQSMPRLESYSGNRNGLSEHQYFLHIPDWSELEVGILTLIPTENYLGMASKTFVTIPHILRFGSAGLNASHGVDALIGPFHINTTTRVQSASRKVLWAKLSWAANFGQVSHRYGKRNDYIQFGYPLPYAASVDFDDSICSLKIALDLAIQ